ncbi:hypothetical protein NS230_03975 [Methylobacterium indicum]|nr:hypothetical protein NS229_02145 [Methylobacterium indicum]KTS53828.1 hypothetical protein NS230_03975 [Methylobacterium indicum]
MRRLVAGAQFREDGLGRLVAAALDAFAPRLANGRDVRGSVAVRIGPTTCEAAIGEIRSPHR